MAGVRQWVMAQMARRWARESEGLDFRNSGRKRKSTSATVGRRRESDGEVQDKMSALD